MATLIILVALMFAAGCSGNAATAPPGEEPLGDGEMAPLNDLTGTYLGFRGRLYPSGNEMPAAHREAGLDRTAAIVPRNVDGDPSPGGKNVLLSIGMSNTTQEFCGSRNGTCNPWTFAGRAAVDPDVDRASLVIVDGARGGQSAGNWDTPDETNYDRIRDQLLAPLGLAESQVAVAWLKVANPRPTVSLPSGEADTYALLTQMGDIVRALAVRYPNLQQVFVSSRIYAGYATTPLNPEPYAFESGLAAKWLVGTQIDQAAGLPADFRAGDLGLGRVPWLAWGPYLWAAGAEPRSDGLVWLPEDFEDDGTHPSQMGESKVGSLLLEFFKTSEHTRCWFLEGMSCS